MRNILLRSYPPSCSPFYPYSAVFRSNILSVCCPICCRSPFNINCYIKRSDFPLSFFKGTLPRNFLPLVFFFKQLLLAPVDKPINDFDFFRIFVEIFNYFGASPVSTTPAMHALPKSLTLVNNSLPVSTTPVSDTFTVLESFTSVNDTGKKFLTGVIDTGKACIKCRCQWHRRSMYLPVSMTLAKHVTSVIDTGDVMHHRCHWYRTAPVSTTPAMHALPLSLTPLMYQ